MSLRSVKARLQLALLLAEVKHGVNAIDRRYRDAVDHFPEEPGKVAVYRDQMLPRLATPMRDALSDAIAAALPSR